MQDLIFQMSIILACSALFSIIAFYLKQPIVVAYIICGIVAGPWGLGLVKDASLMENISRIGVTLLLFLAGLCLHPQKLYELFKRTAIVTLVNSLLSFGIVFGFLQIFNFSMVESLVGGLAMMFSSTILLVKLMPTTELHHERMGATCISILIMQDLLAVLVLVLIRSIGEGSFMAGGFLLLVAKFAAFVIVLSLIEQFVLRPLMKKVDRFQEILFIIGLGWCFGFAAVSHKLGLFYETGAFFAGVVLARQPVAFFLSEKLKPLRDFFLVLFFFMLGASLDPSVMKTIAVPAVILAAIMLAVKPFLFKLSFLQMGESRKFSGEAGVRLGQLSEFSLLIAIMAQEIKIISAGSSQLIQLVTIITMVVSSYIIVFRYPTPIGTSDGLLRD